MKKISTPTSSQQTLFFDTVGETKEDLKAANFQAKSQNFFITEFFKTHPFEKITPFTVWLRLLKKHKGLLLGSVRRTLVVLTNMEILIHHKNVKKKEGYGRKNTCWQYNPRQPEKQQPIEDN